MLQLVNLVAGRYVFTLTVVDGEGLSSSAKAALVVKEGEIGYTKYKKINALLYMSVTSCYFVCFMFCKCLFCTGHFVMVTLNLTLSRLFATFLFSLKFSSFYLFII